MARTPDGPAIARPLTGLTGNSNLEPYRCVDEIDIEAWLYWRKVKSYIALVAETIEPISDPDAGESYLDSLFDDPDDYDYFP